MKRSTHARVCVSGYFSPVHVGHLEYLQKAKDIAGEDGELVVIVNNDHQEILKKGKVFMKGVERVKIMQALRMVDEVVLSIDQDRTVCQTLASIQPPVTHFCNGGDQNNDSIPEASICQEIGIELIDGLGDKIQSSSWLTGLKALK
jgi:cytidyltransferase-like protein